MSGILNMQYQIELPFTLEEHDVGKLYCVAEASKRETGGGEGIEIVVNEPFEKDDKEAAARNLMDNGQYTHKIFHLASKVPAFIRLLAPKGSLEIHEKSWNIYPYCRTEYSNPDYMKEGFHIIIETVHKSGRADDEQNKNAQPFSGEPIAIDIIDIVNDPISTIDYREDEDPSKYHSSKTGRGPLTNDWKENPDYPVMTVYKKYEIQFKWWGLQDKVQSVIKRAVRRLLLNFHRQMFCWLDRWHGMTMEDIRTMEGETKTKLEEIRNQGEARGMMEK